MVGPAPEALLHALTCRGRPRTPVARGRPRGLDLVYSRRPQAGPARPGTGERLARKGA